jgi:pyruvate formate lyase activating enzyme
MITSETIKPEARYYEVLPDGRVRCLLCPIRCKLSEGKEGICMGRINDGGRMIASNYGEVVSVHVDPIEKKPLYHFHPGDAILSVGPNGCNLSCKNCQNWTISQSKQPTTYVSPERLVETTIEQASAGIAYTYSEPLIWFEYLCDTASLAHERGLYNVCVTNGHINADPLKELLPLIDAVNVDVKSIDPGFYRRVCKGRLDAVKNTVETCVGAGIHVEVTNLLIPGLNDSEKDIRELLSWIASLDKNIPFHISRYFPNYQMDLAATPMSSLECAYRIAREFLDFVYVGNAQIEGTSDTICPSCGALLISRSGYATRVIGLKGNECEKCGARLNVVN